MTKKRAVARRRGFRTSKEATLAAAELQLQIENGEYWSKDDGETITYNEMYEKWLKVYKINREPSTILKTRRMFKNHFIPKFGSMDLTEITPLILHDFAVELIEKYKRGDTMFNYAIQPLKLAFKLEIIKNDPSANVDRPRANKKSSKLDDFYESWQLQLFLDISKQLADVNYKQYAFYYLLAITGMRKQEICALIWKDIDFENKTVSINKVVSRDEKNGLYIADRTKNKTSTRTISIDQATIVVMKNWLSEQQQTYENLDESWLVFGADRGNKRGDKILSMNTARSWRLKVQDLMDAEMGMELKRIDTHGFRHTHITLLAQNGASFKSIQARVGHGDAKTTLNIYMHATAKSDSELVDMLPNLIDKKDETE